MFKIGFISRRVQLSCPKFRGGHHRFGICPKFGSLFFKASPKKIQSFVFSGTSNEKRRQLRIYFKVLLCPNSSLCLHICSILWAPGGKRQLRIYLQSTWTSIKLYHIFNSVQFKSEETNEILIRNEEIVKLLALIFEIIKKLNF